MTNHLQNYGADTTDLEGVESTAKSISCSSARSHLRDIFTLAAAFKHSDFETTKNVRKTLVRLSAVDLLSCSARLIQAGVSLEQIQAAMAELENGIRLV